MSYFQATTHKPHSALIAYKPEAGLGRTGELLRRHSLCPHSTRSHKLQDQVYPRLVLVSACHKRFGPVYALSGKDNPEIVNDLFSMESLNKAMAAKKQRSIQDLLMGQIAKIRGQGSGGNGGNKNRYGGGGGGSDGPDDKSFKDSLYELIQIFIYPYYKREELYRLGSDYSRYLVTGKRTARLKRAMLNWRYFSESITKKDSTQDFYGRPIDSESTWWQQPKKFVHRLEELFRGYLRPHAQES